MGDLGTSPHGANSVLGSTTQRWHWDIWQFYDSSGPLKFAGMYRGNMYRGVRLGIGVRPENDPDGKAIAADDILNRDRGDVKAPPGVPLDLIKQAQAELGRIRGRLGKQQILYDLGVNLTIAGDCRLAVVPDLFEPGGEYWQVFSVLELRQSGTWNDGTPRWTETGPPQRELPQGTMVWRIYNPHPGRHAYADSSAMGVLNDLEELQLLGRSFRGLAKNRIAGAGVFAIASELGLGVPADPQKPNGPSKIVADLVRQASTALKSEDAASNLVPHVIEGPLEILKDQAALRHIPFVRPADQLMNDREKVTLERTAIGLDTPPETILGIGDVNHWNGAQVSEDAWKAHGEPGMTVICAQLAAHPLRALLSGAATIDPTTGGPFVDEYGVPTTRWTPQQIAQIVVIADPVAVISRPDRGKDAKDLHDRFVVSDATLREATNFTDADKPSALEVDQRTEQQRLIHSRGSEVQAIPPGYVAGPPAKGGSTLPATTPGGGGTVSPIRPPTAGPPQGAPPTRPGARGGGGRAPARTAAITPPASGRDPGLRVADIDRALFAAVHATIEAALQRALERAGNRIATGARRNRQLTSVVNQTPRAQLAAALGPAVVASIVAADDLLPDFTDVLDDADRRTDRARTAGLTAILTLAGQQLTAAAGVDYQSQVGRHKADGRAWLGAALTTLVADRMYAPADDGTVEAVAGEEIDSSVPPGLVRTALALYGGQPLGADMRPDDGSPFRGVAGGADNLTVGASLGIVTNAWQWAHGNPMRPFEPHEELDGEVFTDDDSADPSRDAGGFGWLGTTMFYPGDHDGCTCWAIPLLSAGEV